jgi:uncharacterized protein (TIGR03435 family)
MRVLLCAVMVTAGPVAARAQLLPNGGAVVEVASVRRHDPADFSNTSLSVKGDTVVASNFPLMQMISSAYRVQRSQLIGGPDWLQVEERYDVIAKSPTPIGGDALAPILRAVLADRFKLRVHTESRERAVYALVLDRADRRLGPRLKATSVTCGSPAAGTPPPPEADARPRCVMSMPPGRVVGVGIDMRILASSLSNQLDRTVVDRTGLTGGFEIDLAFVPERVRPGAVVDGVPLVTALREQLGLKLEPDRAPVEVIVIDSIEHPTEN